jgi:ankyrin repeat protein
LTIQGALLLTTAAAHGHKPAAEWLLQHGVAVNAVDNIGETALHHVSGSSCDEAAVIELLLANLLMYTSLVTEMRQHFI